MDPPIQAPGDTATLILTTNYGGDFEPGQKFDVWIEGEGDSVGTLLAGTQTGKLLTHVASPVKYIAPSSVDNSKKFQVGAFAYGFVAGGDERRALVDIAPVLTKVSRPATLQAVKQPTRRKTIAEPNRRFAVEGCTLPGEVEVPAPRTILLGETKYYYAVKDDLGKLVIKETTNKDVSEGIPQVVLEDPVIAEDAVNNEKIGVYWEYLKPNGDGLADGVIRIVGRYWKQDTTYKVGLRAVLHTDGSTRAVKSK